MKVLTSLNGHKLSKNKVHNKNGDSSAGKAPDLDISGKIFENIRLYKDFDFKDQGQQKQREKITEIIFSETNDQEQCEPLPLLMRNYNATAKKGSLYHRRFLKDLGVNYEEQDSRSSKNPLDRWN